MKKKIYAVYEKLYSYFGAQRWWPAKTPFEVMVGAILTQNTSWSNVEKAISNLKKYNLLQPGKIYKLPHKKLASFIRSAGYYNVKAKRLKEFMDFLFKTYKGDLTRISSIDAPHLRSGLLSVKGIGPETADSMLLYAFNKPVFVVDAYTKRIFLRHDFIKEDATYDEVQSLFMGNLKHDARLFNEYHALLVRLGKEFCRKRKPRCETCPLKKV